ncbi:hypothetical protein [Sphingobacterium tabacisoli]|uniref:DUF4988 domain-containing protein n=1 Tax=Sphingobacterium tabacisoli TaxID=2044855 RepID=A0ABW5L6F7_9SPHI|nr:hypothetical protein [Sphingobacterium tabacisoli]
MKIRNLSKVALAIAISSAVVLEGCKKYDDDISRLEQNISQNTSDIASLKTSLASLATNMVVESVTSVPGGFDIVFKKPDGTKVPYQIRNGADGAKGDKGDTGATGSKGDTGAAGAAGSSPIVTIGQNGNFWIANNGGAAADTGVKAQGPKGDKGDKGETGETGQTGQTGQTGSQGPAGQNGTVVSIVTGNDGKQYWALDGTQTNVQAYAGDIAVVEVDGGYNVIFTDAKGATSDSVFLATEAVAVNSLSIVPTFTNNNSPVVFFPRIVESNTNRTTLLQGYAEIKYNLNPFGVKTENYDATGLLTQSSEKVEFRSSGGTINSNFTAVGPAVKTFGDITVKYRPSNANSTFPTASATTDLFIALQVNNAKAATGQKFAASPFNIAKEEIVEKDEITIEKSSRNAQSTGDKVTLLNGVNPVFTGSGNTAAFVDGGSGSQSLAHTKAQADARTDANFELHFKNDATTNLDNNTSYRGGIVLDDKLNGFFGRAQVNNNIVSMDDHGLSDYNLRYDIDHYSSTDPEKREWLDLDPVTGKISVKISTTTPNTYNFGATNNYAVVRVSIYPGTGSTNVIAHRFIKVNFVQSAVAPVAVNGTFSHDVVNTASVNKNITWSTPTTLDAAYATTGKPAVDFHNVYTFAPSAGNPAGFTFDVPSMNAPQGSPRIVAIENTVMPGTYTLHGTYTSSVSTDPAVNVTITVTVTGNNITTLTKDLPFWDANQSFGIINGKLVSGNWELHANLWDYWTETTVSGSNLPVMGYAFGVSPAVNGINISGNEVQLNSSQATARAKVNNGMVSLSINRTVNGVTYNNGLQTSFDVKFINPVKAIEAKTPYKEFTDKEVSGTNVSEIDVRRLITIKDFNNTVLYNFNGGFSGTKNTGLISDYGINGISPTFGSYNLTNVSFVRYENANGTAISAPSGASASVNGQNLVWTNSGANLQQSIYLVYKVTVTNKFNVAGLPATEAEVVKEIKIRVNPNI